MKFPSPGGAVYNMGHPCCLCATFSVYPSCKHLTWYVVGIIIHELELSQKLEVVVYLGHPVLLSSLCAPNIIEIYLVVCGSYQYTPTRGGSVYGLGLGMSVYMGHPVLPVCVRCFLPDIWYGRSSATGDSSRRDPGHNGPAHLKVSMTHPLFPLDKS